MSNNEFTNEDFLSLAKEMEAEAQKGTFQSPYWKPTGEGTSQIRILTPLKQFGERLFYEKHKFHYIGNRGYYCLNQTLKDKNGNVHEAETCPICQKSKQLYNTSTRDSEEWSIASSLRAKDRYVSRVIVRGKKTKDGQDDEAKPEFWEFGVKIHGYFFDQIKLGEAGNFLSLKDGRDYNLVKKGTGRNTDYSASCLSMKQSPVFSDTEKLKKLLEYLPSMEYSQLVEFESPEVLSAALNEMMNGGASEPAPALAPAENPALDPFSQPATKDESPSEAPADDIDSLLSMI